MSVSTYNLARNSRVVFTTNLDTSNKVNNATGTFTTTNSQELTVLDGFTFSQTTNADTVTISEAGGTPTRGQRSFNTQLNPVDFSFSTYIRPYLSTTVESEESVLWNALFTDYGIGATGATVAIGTATGATFTASTATSAPRISITGTALVPTIATTASAATLVIGEIVTIKGAVAAGASSCNVPVRIVTATSTSIVADFLSDPVITPTSANFITGGITLERTAWTKNAAVAGDTAAGGVSVAYSEVNIGRSNVNQLLPFGMVMTVDNVTYLLDNCVMDQASIDFGLDGIATVQWTGKATNLRQLTTTVAYSSTTGNPVLSNGLTGTITAKASSTKYITNKLSTVSLISKIYGNDGTAGTSFNIPLTGGSLTIANNVNYITPANIGVVNSPIGYYTGTRAISGTLNAYLRTGTTSGVANVAGLLSSMLAASTTSVEPKYQLNIAIGGSNNAVRVEALINGANLQIPTVDAQAVLSTAINFTAQGVDDYKTGQNYNLELPNELRVRYLSN